MEVHNNYQLKSLNTFHVAAISKFFTTFSSTDDLQEILESYSHERKLILGGGSNILLTKDYDGIVLKNNLKGISVSAEDENYVHITAAAGESWNGLVEYCVNRDFGGIENLSLIPGNVGAAPIQNIGAYGVELKDVFYELNAFHLYDKKKIKFSSADCAFGYRDSIFKKKCKGQFAILDITMKLSKRPVPNISYATLQKALENINIQDLTVKQVSEEVNRIRKSKLPDPAEIGNAGSFFKNPEISEANYLELQLQFPGIVSYQLPNGNRKLAAAWLIEQCGYKGFRRGDAGCHEKQALVLVNYGEASGEDIYTLSDEIMKSVRTRFSIVLEREVNII